MADLVARDRDGQQRWRHPLPETPVQLGRVAPPSTWDARWDHTISSLHANLVWREGKLHVRRLPTGRNPIFFRGRDQGFQEFAVALGELFVIGETTFAVLDTMVAGKPDSERTPIVDSTPEHLRPDSELTCSQEQLSVVRYPDADERIEVLAALPELIRFSPSDEALENRVVDVLLRGITRAEAAGVVRLLSQEGERFPAVEVRAAAGRGSAPVELRPSRRLVDDALRRRRQSVLYRWDNKQSQDFTADAAFDWAICAPLPEVPCPDWGLYVVGRRQPFTLRLQGPSLEELLTGDLKFAKVVADIFGSLRQVQELQAEKAQMLASLRVAHEVQAGFFPRTMPSVPGYEFAASSRSAEATGGDYYDAIRLPSGRVGLVVADVCGHGLGPSLLMASVRAVLRGFAIRDTAPDVLLTDLNEALFDDLVPQRRFITLLYGMLAPAEHRFYHANAGHGPVALHLPATANRCHWLLDDDARGCPLGILRERYQACAPVELAPGDLLILGSDGIVETRRDGKTWGLERLTEFILQHRDRPLQEILDGVMEATTAYHEQQRPDDDLTLMIVRRQRTG